ncbi:SEC-independent protein TATD [Stappia sp. 22II-S9-Z10]|nr:SEC-independent protein TATD [Stappia sp. 22II-S9-Z10]
MRLVDSHCHLDFPDFEDLGPFLERARSRGIERFVTISTRMKSFARLQEITAAHEDVYCSVGVHCLNAHEEPDVTAEELVAAAAGPKVVAIGEAGLDYHYTYETRDVQEIGFRRHITAARETGLPLVIHAREADEDVAAILEEETGKGAFPFVLHCFSSGMELATRGLALGGYVSFSGIVTFKTAETIREVAKMVPMDRMLLETDAPYLAPPPHRGKRNEPAFVADTAAHLADTLGLPVEDLGAQTTANFYRLFTKVPAPVAA